MIGLEVWEYKKSRVVRRMTTESLQAQRARLAQEEEHLGNTATGESKYWHTFQVIAQKKTA
jgi:hypothetical protein